MITLEKAHRVIAAVESKAREIDQPVSVAVIAPGTNLLDFTRMDAQWG